MKTFFKNILATIFMTPHGKFVYFIESNQNEKIEKFLKNKKFRYRYSFSKYLYNAVSVQNLEAIKLLLKHSDADPTSDDNFCISQAYNKGFHDITMFLWHIPSVKETLLNDSPDLFNSMKQKELQKNINGF